MGDVSQETPQADEHTLKSGNFGTYRPADSANPFQVGRCFIIARRFHSKARFR